MKGQLKNSILSLLILSTFCFAQSGVDKKKKLTQQIKDQKQQLKKVEERELSIHEELRRYALRFDEINRELSKIRQQEKQLGQKISDTKQHIEALELEIQQTQEEVTRLVQRLHRMERVNPGQQMLFSSQQGTDFYRWRRAFDRWIQNDEQKMKDYQLLLSRLEQEKENLEQAKSDLKKVLKRQEQQRRNLAEKRQEHKKLLALVSNQKSYYRKNIKELEAATKKLNQMISNFSVRRETGFGKMKGRLPMPSDGKIEKRFGPYRDPKMNVQLYHKGIDIRSKSGAEVQAVFDGKVAYADWFDGYGKVIILDHGAGYFSLYAHLSRIFKSSGQQVVVGDLIGEVGDTGSVKGNYLYFELRERGLSVDPLPWLDS